MDETSIVEELTKFNDGVLVANKDNVLDGVDSLGLIELSGFLEERFNILVFIDDVAPENLGTLDRIVRFVQNRLLIDRTDDD